MSLLKKYNEALQKAQEKAQELEEQNIADETKLAALEEEYKSKVADLDIEAAEEVNGRINQLKSKIKVRGDFIEQLDPNANPKVLKAAVEAINKYATDKKKVLHKGEVLEGKLAKKKAEYLDIVEQIKEVNSECKNLKREIMPLKNKYDWNSLTDVNIDVAKETDPHRSKVNEFLLQKYKIEQKDIDDLSYPRK